jgi:hypothetical protein
MTNQVTLATIDHGIAPSAHTNYGDVGINVRVARTVEQVEEIRDVWISWPGHRDSDINFYLELIRSHPEVLRPHIVVLYRSGRPVAMLIGRLERTELVSKIGYFRLPGIRARTLNFVYGGLRGSASDENSRELVGSVIQSLRSGEADAVFLHQPSTDSFLYKAALKMPGSWCCDRLSKPEKHHTINFPDTVEKFYQGLSKSLRGELRRKRKKLFEDFEGKVTVKCYQDLRDLASALPHLEEIAKKTYQRGLGVGFQDTPQMRRRLELCAAMGWLRIYVLYIEGIPRSFSAGTVYDSVYTTDYIAYDPAFRDYYLGKLLLVEVIEHCYRENVRAIDFGFGQAEYKERFGNCTLTESSVYIFAPSLRGLALNATRTVSGFIDSTLKATLERTQLLQRIKKLWRGRAAHNAQVSGGSVEN